MKNRVVLGLDGGGTFTRVAITDTNGKLLSYVEFKGAASKNKDKNAKENVFNAVHKAAKKANCELGDIIGFAAGIAGYDSEKDLEWVRDVTDIDGLTCTIRNVNDSVIAQKGAFLLQPGIIAISGTGSNILGINEAEDHICSFDFHHYAPTAARFLAYDSVYKVIAGETDETDSNFVDAVLNHFKVNSLSDLIKLGSKGFVDEYTQRAKLFGELAPAVTAAALNGSHLAEQICVGAVTSLITGIKLVGACFESDTVSVALIGSVANSTFIKDGITERLSKKSNNKNYLLAEPALPPVLGAIMMAMQFSEIPLNHHIISNLYESASNLQK